MLTPPSRPRCFCVCVCRPTGVHRHSDGAVPKPSGCAGGHEVRDVGEGEHHLRDTAGGGTYLIVPLPLPSPSTQYSLTVRSIKLQGSFQELCFALPLAWCSFRPATAPLDSPYMGPRLPMSHRQQHTAVHDFTLLWLHGERRARRFPPSRNGEAPFHCLGSAAARSPLVTPPPSLARNHDRLPPKRRSSLPLNNSAPLLPDPKRVPPPPSLPQITERLASTCSSAPPLP